MISITDKINHLLETITIKGKNCDLIVSQYISGIRVKDNEVGLSINVNQDNQEYIEEINKKIRDIITQIPEIKKVNIVLTGEQNYSNSYPEKQKIALPKIKKIIAIASGKGGVGKSTTAVNLALALSKIGYKIGLADADIYGPSIPTMLGIEEKPEIKDQKMIPIIKYGIKTMSLGYLAPKDSAVIWRGPMSVKALHQVLYGTDWEELDYLIIDMPPGTGDIHLSLAENYRIDGIIIVSTPQTTALADVARAINMYQKMHIPIIGCVENMSYFIDQHTGSKSYIFGQDGLKNLAYKLNLKMLAEISLDMKIRVMADIGKSVLEDDKIAKIYLNLAKQVIVAIS
jgi:ATP-binding protein involved in chromosome partitioning